MRFFDRERGRSGSAQVLLPGDFARTLEAYGRWQFDPPGSGIDPTRIGNGNIEYELFMLAQTDGDAFVDAVAAIAIPAGEWALYGGERAVMNSVGPDTSHPAYLEMMDGAIAFLRAQGYGWIDLPPYMLRRWEQTREASGA